MAQDKPRKPRKKTYKGHPFLEGREKGAWYADAVGVVPGYPKTPETKTRRETQRRRPTKNPFFGHSRLGVPDGWAGRKQELKEAREQGAKDAKMVYQAMIDKKILDEAAMLESPSSAMALLTAVEVCLSKSKDGQFVETSRERLNAAKLILDHFHVKPAQRSEVKLDSAEDFLALVSKEAPFDPWSSRNL